MSLKLNCPTVAVPDLINPDCGYNFGQIVRFAFGKMTATFESEADTGDGAITFTFNSSASWSARIIAADGTKLQLTPIHENVVIPQGEAVTEGKDSNESSFGAEVVLGSGTSTLTGRYRNLDRDAISGLKSYIGEAALYNNMGVYMINEWGQVIGKQPLGTGTTVTPIPISAYFIGSSGTEGFNQSTFTPFQFSLYADWDEDLVTVDPSTATVPFNLLTLTN